MLEEHRAARGRVRIAETGGERGDRRHDWSQRESSWPLTLVSGDGVPRARIPGRPVATGSSGSWPGASTSTRRSGLVVAAAIAVLLVAAGPEAFRWSFVLMLVATLIDATDGTLARRVGVKKVLPNFDGRKLDDLTDFLTYTFLPLLLIWRAEVLPAGWQPWLLLPLLASAYGFCQVEAKTDDGYFLGFPSLWNVVAFYLYVLPLPALAGAGIVDRAQPADVRAEPLPLPVAARRSTTLQQRPGRGLDRPAALDSLVQLPAGRRPPPRPGWTQDMDPGAGLAVLSRLLHGRLVGDHAEDAGTAPADRRDRHGADRLPLRGGAVRISDGSRIVSRSRPRCNRDRSRHDVPSSDGRACPHHPHRGRGGATIRPRRRSSGLRREKGLAIVEKAATSYPKHRDCFACHHQTLPMLAIVTAAERGWKADLHVVEEQAEFTRTSFTSRLDALKAGKDIGGRSMTVGYVPVLDLAGHEADELSAAMVTFLAEKSGEIGRLDKLDGPSAAGGIAGRVYGTGTARAWPVCLDRSEARNRERPARAGAARG